MRHFVFLIAIFASLIPDLRAGEPFFKPGDVVALIGGEDMVVAAELGYLETLIQLALPDHHLKFRSLAREGDTVFEQRRDLNYPSLEAQLDKMGATVVICQFGQMESLAGGAAESAVAKDEKDKSDEKDAGKVGVPFVPFVPFVPEKADATRKAKVAEFVAAYEKLIGRVKGKDGKRRIALVVPAVFAFQSPIRVSKTSADQESIGLYHSAIADCAKKNTALKLASDIADFVPASMLLENHTSRLTDNAYHLWAADIARSLIYPDSEHGFLQPKGIQKETEQTFAKTVATKNRLWYYYYRPQNWAFLAGDRTNQPSSRDHLDPSKRWFPEELEKFVPLIDAKDAEIWALAKKLSAEGGK